VATPVPVRYDRLMLAEDEYVRLAHDELQHLIERLDALETDRLEVELASDILTLEFDDGTKYVVNSHRAARQIWMAAERSAWHFDWDPSQGRWIASKSGDELWSTLGRLTEQKLGTKLALGQRPGV
jgi:CyaY protein